MSSLTALAMASVGCGGGVPDPYDRVGYSGTVMLDGAPMKCGVLYLEPLERQPTQSFASIANGKFVAKRTEGAVPGRYKVAIVLDDAFELPEGVDIQTPEGSAMADKLSREYKVKTLHPSYNVQSRLEAELKQDAPNEFIFDLKSNPGK